MFGVAADVGADEDESDELERALPEGEEEAEELPDGGAPEAPAVLSAVPATAANAVAQTAPVPGLSLLHKA